MRIALLMNGMTGYLEAEFRQLHALGNELLVVTPEGDGFDEAMADTEFRLETRSYAQVHGWHAPPEPAELVALVREFRPDAVVMTSWNFTKAYRAVMKNVPSGVVRVLIMDNMWRGAPKQWLGRAIHRFYVDTVADAAMVPSDRTENYAKLLGFAPEDIIRGSLSCDTSLFHSGPRTGDELASRRSFLYVGRLVWHKGADVLAAAYRRYRELTDDPWDLHVAGKGPLEGELTAIDGVTMHGFVQPPDVARMMREVSCFVLTSHIEPYGVVVHEAAASGLPVLCSDFTGAAAGLMQDGRNGWVVSSGRIELWAQAMARMSALPPQRLQQMSDVSRAIATRFSPEGWALNVHEELTRRKAAGGGRLAKL
ncbi:MAG TPA: glycosyltransferase family 4 protein [Jatrophihabitantaceae bacterium]|nr:glycosyltransferase family 4 protein [Jatrophihabitantaceae bacterium]